MHFEQYCVLHISGFFISSIHGKCLGLRSKHVGNKKIFDFLILVFLNYVMYTDIEYTFI